MPSWTDDEGRCVPCMQGDCIFHVLDNQVERGADLIVRAARDWQKGGRTKLLTDILIRAITLYEEVETELTAREKRSTDFLKRSR